MSLKQCEYATSASYLCRFRNCSSCLRCDVTTPIRNDVARHRPVAVLAEVLREVSVALADRKLRAVRRQVLVVDVRRFHFLSDLVEQSLELELRNALLERKTENRPLHHDNYVFKLKRFNRIISMQFVSKSRALLTMTDVL